MRKTAIWRAQYKDGSIISYSDINPVTNKPFNPDRLDRDSLYSFSLTIPDSQSVELVFNGNGRRLIYFQRHYQICGGRRTFHFVGWRQNVKGKNVQSVLVLDEDGKIGPKMIGDFIEGHPLFDPPSEKRMAKW